MKRSSKLQILDLQDERSVFERELTTEEIKNMLGGGGRGAKKSSSDSHLKCSPDYPEVHPSGQYD
jgi:hypothetical protein